MRKRLYEIIEVASDDDKLSKIYDICMMLVIVASIFPLAVRTQNKLFNILDLVTVVIFILDYILRIVTADMNKLEKF